METVNLTGTAAWTSVSTEPGMHYFSATRVGFFFSFSDGESIVGHPLPVNMAFWVDVPPGAELFLRGNGPLQLSRPT